MVNDQLDLDPLFTNWNTLNTPGIAVVVVREGKIVYQRAYGSAHLEHDVPITPTTVFDVGSAAKQFTAFGIAMLSQAGKLDLDAEVHIYLDELPDFGRTITLRHLLHHTSGLWNWSALTQWVGQIATLDDVMRVIARQRTLNFAPGTRFQYCNTGYNLLARIVERVTGQTFREWTTNHIFLPLGMKDTVFQDDTTQAIKGRANGYVPSGDGGFKSATEDYPVGSSALWTTANDLACWLENLDSGQVGGEALLEQIRQTGTLENGERLQYAFGLFVGEYKGRLVLEHGGECRGYRSAIRSFPDSRFGVAVLANLKSVDVWGIARQISDICLFVRPASAKSAGSVRERPAVPIDPALYKAYIGHYLIEPGHILTILTKEDRLFWQITGQPRFELLPQSETEFLDKDGDPVSFHRDERGKVNQVTLIWEWGQSITAQRIEPSAGEPLHEYKGTYSSVELDTIYRIGVWEGRLIARHVRHEDISLAYCAPDQFAGEPWWFRRVDFVRDHTGQIVAFQLTTREGFKELTFRKTQGAHLDA